MADEKALQAMQRLIDEMANENTLDRQAITEIDREIRALESRKKSLEFNIESRKKEIDEMKDEITSERLKKSKGVSDKSVNQRAKEERQKKMDRLDDLWDNLVEAKNSLRKQEREGDPIAKVTKEYIEEVEAEISKLKQEIGSPFSKSLPNQRAMQALESKMLGLPSVRASSGSGDPRMKKLAALEKQLEDAEDEAEDATDERRRAMDELEDAEDGGDEDEIDEAQSFVDDAYERERSADEQVEKLEKQIAELKKELRV